MFVKESLKVVSLLVSLVFSPARSAQIKMADRSRWKVKREKTTQRAVLEKAYTPSIMK